MSKTCCIKGIEEQSVIDQRRRLGARLASLHRQHHQRRRFRPDVRGRRSDLDLAAAPARWGRQTGGRRRAHQFPGRPQVTLCARNSNHCKIDVFILLFFVFFGFGSIEGSCPDIATSCRSSLTAKWQLIAITKRLSTITSASSISSPTIKVIDFSLSYWFISVLISTFQGTSCVLAPLASHVHFIFKFIFFLGGVGVFEM